MSMLAERRRKTKWSLNPTGRLWSDDKNKFGQRMLEKMGWKEGSGLGAQLQGPKEHVRVSTKNDNKGLGFKSSDEAWFKVQEDYEKLLSEMSATYSGGAGTSPPRERKSLEEISRSSRARIHYAKFIRGKDMSRYSEKDLACIFGKPLNKTKPQHQADSSYAMQHVKISEHSDTQTTHTLEASDEFETVGENTESMGCVDVASTEDILNCNSDESQSMCKKKKKKKKSPYECMDGSSELCENSHLDACGSSCQLEVKDSDTRVVDNDKSYSNQYIDHDVDFISQKVKKKSKRKDSSDNEQYVDQKLESIDSDGRQQKSADFIKCCRCGQICDLNTLRSGSQEVADCYSRMYHEPTYTKREKKKLKEDQNDENNMHPDLDPSKTIEAHSERKKKKKKHLKKDDDSVCVSDENIVLGCDNLDAQCVESKSDRKQEKRKKKHEFEMTSQSHYSDVSEDSYKPSSLKNKLSTTGRCAKSSHFNTGDTNEKSQKNKYEVDVQEKEPCKKKFSSKNQVNGSIRNEERCSSYPNDHSELDECNSEKRHRVAEDISAGTSSDVDINDKKNKRKREEASFSGTLQDKPTARSLQME
ncbi:G patch domain-containing protein 4 isoform X2 [Anabrus simplex]|uniref:G patch domain-containing protein 4 isoform X2 n=1 Tax=Anabrus simplex TaxID=316456 RepID=UPI0035A2C24C